MAIKNIDAVNLVSALTACAALKSCDRCPYKDKCLSSPSTNAAMADAAAYIREASGFIKEHTTLRLSPKDLVGIFDPVYIITDPPDIDTWMFYVGHIERKGLFLFRDPDGSVHDFWEKEYGKTWLAFSGRVTDKEWEEAKKEMDSNQTES